MAATQSPIPSQVSQQSPILSSASVHQVDPNLAHYSPTSSAPTLTGIAQTSNAPNQSSLPRSLNSAASSETVKIEDRNSPQNDMKRALNESAAESEDGESTKRFVQSAQSSQPMQNSEASSSTSQKSHSNESNVTYSAIVNSASAAYTSPYTAPSPVCQNCNTNTTPLWRRDDAGQILCNACGLFLKLHGRPRPSSLKTDVIKSRNRIRHAVTVPPLMNNQGQPLPPSEPARKKHHSVRFKAKNVRTSKSPTQQHIQSGAPPLHQPHPPSTVNASHHVTAGNGNGGITPGTPANQPGGPLTHGATPDTPSPWTHHSYHLHSPYHPSSSFSPSLVGVAAAASNGYVSHHATMSGPEESPLMLAASKVHPNEPPVYVDQLPAPMAQSPYLAPHQAQSDTRLPPIAVDPKLAGNSMNAGNTSSNTAGNGSSNNGSNNIRPPLMTTASSPTLSRQHSEHTSSSSLTSLVSNNGQSHPPALESLSSIASIESKMGQPLQSQISSKSMTPVSQSSQPRPVEPMPTLSSLIAPVSPSYSSNLQVDLQRLKSRVTELELVNDLMTQRVGEVEEIAKKNERSVRDTKRKNELLEAKNAELQAVVRTLKLELENARSDNEQAKLIASRT